MNKEKPFVLKKLSTHLNMASVYEDTIVGVADILLEILCTETESVQLENEGQVR